MPYTIPFTDDELRRIETAERAGFDVSAFFRAKVHELPTIAPTDTLTRPSPPVRETPTPEQIAQEVARIQAQIDAIERMTPEEREEADKKWDDFTAAINAERDRAGARRVF